MAQSPKPVEPARAHMARAWSEWLAGRTDVNPYGATSTQRHILPSCLTSNTRDARDWRFSEWGEAAGMTPPEGS